VYAAPRLMIRVCFSTQTVHPVSTCGRRLSGAAA